MNKLKNPIRKTLTTICCVLAVSAPAGAQSDDAPDLEQMLAELADPQAENWQELEDRIADLWSRSGSRSLDLLLSRGQEAVDAKDYPAAIEHLTALTDHAPEFAEGWNLRATAFFLMDEYGLALDDLARTLSLNPKQFGAYYGAGVILEQLDRPEAALKAYRAAFAIHPHQTDFAEAIERLERQVDGWAL